MSKRRPYYISEDQWIEDLPSYVLNVAYQYLPLNIFGFRETYRDDERVILNSEYCRVQLYTNWEMHPYDHHRVEYDLFVLYGRLHAPNRDFEMKWQGETCECWIRWWHDVFDFLRFAFPEYAMPSLGDIIDEFMRKKREFQDMFHWRLAIESELWKYYTPHLFELLDLHRPKLWEQYRAWLRARYIAEGRNEEDDKRKGLIPYYRVC